MRPRLIRSLRTTTVLALAFATTSVLALDPTRSITQYVRDAWGKKDGLPVNSANAIVQTRDGYLWFGTDDGLARFDGVHFTLFSAGNTQELEAGDDIKNLYEDREGSLWIGTPDGLLRYQEGRFTRFTTADGLSDSRVYSVLRDSRDTLWVGTGKSLHSFKDGRFHAVEMGALKAMGSLSVIHECVDGTLWAAGTSLFTLEHGVLTNQSKRFHFDSYATTMVDDGDGGHWIGTRGHGVAHLKGETLTYLSTGMGFPLDWVSSLLLDRDGNLWIGTMGGGLSLHRHGVLTSLTEEDLPGGREILALLEDREGNVWAGTSAGGVARLKDSAFATFSKREGVSGQSIASVYEDRSGALWIGAMGAGLTRMERGHITTYSKKDGLVSDTINAIYEDADGALWLGTDGAGVNRLRDGRFTIFRRAETPHLPDDVIYSIVEQPESASVKRAILLGTGAGILGRNYSDLTKPFSIILGEGEVIDLRQGLDGAIWAGTYKGLYRIAGTNKPVKYTTSEGLSGDRVFATLEDRDGTIWIGTYGGGLTRLRDGKFTIYREKDGLGNDSILSVLGDDQGNLWLGSNNGVIQVSKRELDDFAEGKVTSIHSRTYGRADGVRADECNGPAGAARGRDGKLWFATHDGVAMVDPTRLRTNTKPPPLVIEQMICDEKAMTPPHGGAFPRIPAGTKSCEIHYAALSFVAPERVKFKYRLDGSDTDWVDAGTRRVAYFTHLPPGRHRFEVTACNNDGVWNQAGAQLAFDLDPYFHQTWLFYGICLAGAVLAGGGVHSVRVRRLNAQRVKLSGLVEAKTRDLEQRTRELLAARDDLTRVNETLEQRVTDGIAALREAERMAAYGRLVAGVAHEVRHPIFALQAAAYVLGDSLRNREDLRSQLRTLELETKRMGTLMTELLEFAKPAALDPAPTDPASVVTEAVEVLQAEHGPGALPVTIVSEEGLPRVVMDRGRILQVLVNLMENASKHAKGATAIKVRVALDGPSQITFSVDDDGGGILREHLISVFDPFFTTGRGTGLGLAIVRRIVSDHRGTVDVTSEPGRGARFTIRLPVEGLRDIQSPGG